VVVLVQIAWYGSEKVMETDAENGPVSGISQSSAEDGTQLINAMDDSESLSGDELFGLLDKSGGDRKVTNGNYAVLRDLWNISMLRSVQQYVGNMSTILSGISIDRSTIVQ